MVVSTGVLGMASAPTFLVGLKRAFVTVPNLTCEDIRMGALVLKL